MKSSNKNKYQKILQKISKDPKIIDCIIFGSSVKGKIRPNDIDIALLVKEKLSQKEFLSIKKQLQTEKQNVHLQQVGIEEYNSTLFTVLLREGFSIRYKKFLHQLYKISPTYLFVYSLKSLTPSQRVMFHRGIKNIKGIQRLSNTVVMVPIQEAANFQDFLKQWKIDIDTKEYSLLPQLRKEMF